MRVVASPRRAGWRRWIFAAAVVGTLVALLLFAALLLQLSIAGALEGGRRSRELYPNDGPLWLHLFVNRYTVRIVSRSGDTVAPLAVLALATWLSVRARRWLPLASLGAALLLALGVLVLGKGKVGDLIGVDLFDWDLSGPGTTVVVVGGIAAWLLRDELDRATGRAVWWLAGAVALAVAGTQLYMGHEWASTLLSLVSGAGIVGVVMLLFRGRPGAPGRSAFDDGRGDQST